MDVVWLKKDLRLRDHGPLSMVSKSKRQFCILYMYEKDQLSHHSVHGSHIHFANEGLADLEDQLCKVSGIPSGTDCIIRTKGEATDILTSLHRKRQFTRLLAHEETGHNVSYARDIRVRKWCFKFGVQFIEFNQTGVTRRLQNRDSFSKLFNKFIAQQMHKTPIPGEYKGRLLLPQHFEKQKEPRNKSKVVTDQGNTANMCPTTRLHCGIQHPLDLVPFFLAKAHSADREERQKGGERTALRILCEFFERRGKLYAQHISSPNTSWSSCSRISPYLTFGNISLRYVLKRLINRQREERLKTTKTTSDLGPMRKRTRAANQGEIDGPMDLFTQPQNSPKQKAKALARKPTAMAIKSSKKTKPCSWLRSLSAFGSRLRWRSHFIQKFESECSMEYEAQCAAYNKLRVQEWNEEYYNAWATGRTGFPLVDACMRCLHKHGWLNFRMRAMVVSFAAYNLFLDWRGIAPHLARCFLDYVSRIDSTKIEPF